MRKMLAIALLGVCAIGTASARGWGLQRIAFSETNGTTSSEITVSGLRDEQLYVIYGVEFTRTDGAAANYTLKCGTVTGFTDTPAGGLAFSLAQQNVSTNTLHLFDPPVVATSDASGQLYCDANWDAGTDNDASGALIVAKGYP